MQNPPKREKKKPKGYLVAQKKANRDFRRKAIIALIGPPPEIKDVSKTKGYR